MDLFNIKSTLENVVVLVDTREQNTPALRKRLKNMGFPNERQKLNYGDYSVKCLSPFGTIDLSNKVSVERKMSLDELCTCYCAGRKRFEREFERAKADNAKIYMLVEKSDWEKAYSGDYRSQMKPQSLVASMLAWLTRYNCQLIFCEAETTGKLIGDILYREVKERLERGDYDELCGNCDTINNNA